MTTPNLTQRIPVSTNEAITTYLAGFKVGERFTRDNLLSYVQSLNFAVGNGTIMRALRGLKNRSKVNYTVLNALTGIYQIDAVGTTTAPTQVEN